MDLQKIARYVIQYLSERLKKYVYQEKIPSKNI